MRIGFVILACMLATPLAGCATVAQFANCENANRVKAGALALIEAAEKFCPAPVDKPPEQQ